MKRRGLFVSGTTTGAGKTTVTAALARHLVARGVPVAAIKPFETGVAPTAHDAEALAAACGRPDLAHDAAWYRARRALSPYAATLEGEAPPLLGPIVARVDSLGGDCILCEGAGGLLVPLDRTLTIADVAAALELPLLLVAPDHLGVLSDVLAVHEAAQRRALPIAAIVLSATASDADPSTATNQRILSERLDVPVVQVAHHGSVSALATLLAPLLGLPTRGS